VGRSLGVAAIVLQGRRALPFLAASSAAFAASSAFGLALLGAIAGGFLRSTNDGRQMLELALSRKEANKSEQ
jgi:hypothetical protein